MIIGASGYARSGKDTVAGLLPWYQRRAFADKMREAMLALNPIIAHGYDMQYVVARWGWDEAKTMFPEVRRLLQVFGTEVGRSMLGENVWVDLATRDLHGGERIVFTDVRFPNEAERIKSLGGQVWRIERPGVQAVNAHSSETAMDDWPFDAVIVNDGTIEDLQRAVGALVT